MSKPSYAKIRQQVESRFQERHSLKIHGVVYLIVNVLLWGFWFLFPRLAPQFGIELTPSELEFFVMAWPITVTVGWGLALVGHFLSYYLEHGAGARRRERVVQLEVEQEIARRTGDEYLEKPKNDQCFRLTEDGEIETVMSDDESRYQQDAY